MFALSDERPTLEELAERRREIDRLEVAWLRDVTRYDRSHDGAADGYLNAASALREHCNLTPVARARQCTWRASWNNSLPPRPQSVGARPPASTRRRSRKRTH